VVLRDMVPQEYGLSTGFIAYHDGKCTRLTLQLNVIIYDAVRSSPLVRLASCDLFPLEAVYAYHEVTRPSSQLAGRTPGKDSIETCLETGRELRYHRTGRYWAPDPDSRVRTHLIRSKVVPIPCS
jgi:hypothetical protein